MGLSEAMLLLEACAGEPQVGEAAGYTVYPEGLPDTDTGDTATDTGDSADTADTAETGDSADTSDTGDSAETGDTGETGEMPSVVQVNTSAAVCEALILKTDVNWGQYSMKDSVAYPAQNPRMYGGTFLETQTATGDLQPLGACLKFKTAGKEYVLGGATVSDLETGEVVVVADVAGAIGGDVSTGSLSLWMPSFAETGEAIFDGTEAGFEGFVKPSYEDTTVRTYTVVVDGGVVEVVSFR